MTAELFSETCEFDRLADPERFYPVAIQVTETYIVWVDADSPQEAASSIKDSPEEWLEGERPVEAEVSDVTEPYPWAVDEWNSNNGHRDYGPWRFGEPHTHYLARRYREECIAAAMAKGLPTPEPLERAS